MDGDTAPGFGGQVVPNGAPGPSTATQWPSNLLLTMGQRDLVHSPENGTAAEGATGAASATSPQPATAPLGLVLETGLTS